MQNANRGQAAIEALLVIVFGFMLLLSVHNIGQLRSDTLHLLGESHFLSFVPKQIVDEQSLFLTLTKVDNSIVSLTSARTDGFDSVVVTEKRNGKGASGVTLNHEPAHERLATVRLADLAYSAQQRKIENQLGFDSTTLLRASASAAPRVRSDLFTLNLAQQALLERHSFLLLGAGKADSPQAAQTQINGSAALWQESFAPSQQLVNSSLLTLQGIDQAWGRPQLTSEWLLPWANEVLALESAKRTLVRQQTETISQSLSRVFK
jgi:hypothetical protein